MVKKNNPFKLWGSYVGIAIALFINKGKIIDKVKCINDLNCSLNYGSFDLLIYMMISFFLIGWGIHSFINKKRKR